MKVGIMQPYLFPYIGYFHLVQAVDKFVFYDDVNFIKGGWINRNRILINGKESFITLNLSHASPKKLINQIEVIDNRKKLIKTIKLAYNKAPYFEEVFALMVQILSYDSTNISDIAINSIISITEYLKVKTKFIKSSSLPKTLNYKGQERVIRICKELEGKVYINPIGGLELYSSKVFKENGLTLNFLKPTIESYSQFNQEFIPALSIVDILMFNGVKKTSEMIKKYTIE
ncbi:WbqC family protein [Reichenbachiella sp. MALMAid0571]|uniref:WbqC family protein n=1 Tax=Reichenbachiella sp. MALMAid0571 TaxID=3143939 RepID=UPI0032DE8AE3